MALTWSRTFPDTHHDFVAKEDGADVGRIYQHRPGGLAHDVWLWSATGVHAGLDAPAAISGEVLTREAAIAALTQAWERAKAWSARTGKPLVWKGRVYGELSSGREKGAPAEAGAP